MRCVACNKILSPYEDALKGVLSGQHLDTCLSCLADTGIQYKADPNQKEETYDDGSEIEINTEAVEDSDGESDDETERTGLFD